jgi:VIT1/CCC1 family predicted Fe2+/Mn2+ transporter
MKRDLFCRFDLRKTMRRHRPSHRETHHVGRAGWLRAAVLGSNDAIVSTASLMIGVAASSATPNTILVAGVAALVAGAMSMAVGEFVSVSSQRDAERADIAKERQELVDEPQAELEELARIYVGRGLDAALAMTVARQLSTKHRLESHLRDELHIDATALARPFQAAWISAASFSVFAAIPVLALVAVPGLGRVPIVAAISLASLGGLGALGAHLGGAPRLAATVRVTVGGIAAMGISAAVGRLLGASIS